MREPIGKKLRFEVFKRDSFTCQYCGRSAPDVILECDHIKPVATGGDNDITNLVTSCRDCNAGKGPRELSDDAVIAKQRAQLEELNERRLQLEMLLEWREGLTSLRDQAVAAVEAAIRDASHKTGTLTEVGRRDVAKWVRRYPLNDILDAVQAAFDQYLVWEDGKITEESWGKAFDYVPRIAGSRKRLEEKPYLKDLYYIRGILRNRLAFVNERECLSLLERAHLAGASIDGLRDLAKSVQNWASWRGEIIGFLDEFEGGD